MGTHCENKSTCLAFNNRYGYTKTKDDLYGNIFSAAGNSRSQHRITGNMPLVCQQQGANNMLWLPAQLSTYLTLALFRHMKWQTGYPVATPFTKRLVHKTVKRCQFYFNLIWTGRLLYWDVLGRLELDPVTITHNYFWVAFSLVTTFRVDSCRGTTLEHHYFFHCNL